MTKMHNTRPIFVIALVVAIAAAIAAYLTVSHSLVISDIEDASVSAPADLSKPSPKPNPSPTHVSGRCYNSEAGYPPLPLYCCFGGYPGDQINGYCYNGKQDW